MAVNGFNDIKIDILGDKSTNKVGILDQLYKQGVMSNSDRNAFMCLFEVIKCINGYSNWTGDSVNLKATKEYLNNLKSFCKFGSDGRFLRNPKTDMLAMNAIEELYIQFKNSINKVNSKANNKMANIESNKKQINNLWTVIAYYYLKEFYISAHNNATDMSKSPAKFKRSCAHIKDFDDLFPQSLKVGALRNRREINISDLNVFVDHKSDYLLFFDEYVKLSHDASYLFNDVLNEYKREVLNQEYHISTSRKDISGKKIENTLRRKTLAEQRNTWLLETVNAGSPTPKKRAEKVSVAKTIPSYLDFFNVSLPAGIEVLIGGGETPLMTSRTNVLSNCKAYEDFVNTPTALANTDKKGNLLYPFDTKEHYEMFLDSAEFAMFVQGIECGYKLQQDPITGEYSINGDLVPKDKNGNPILGENRYLDGDMVYNKDICFMDKREFYNASILTHGFKQVDGAKTTSKKTVYKEPNSFAYDVYPTDKKTLATMLSGIALNDNTKKAGKIMAGVVGATVLAMLISKCVAGNINGPEITDNTDTNKDDTTAVVIPGDTTIIDETDETSPIINPSESDEITDVEDTHNPFEDVTGPNTENIETPNTGRPETTKVPETEVTNPSVTSEQKDETTRYPFENVTSPNENQNRPSSGRPIGNNPAVGNENQDDSSFDFGW